MPRAALGDRDDDARIGQASACSSSVTAAPSRPPPPSGSR
jgi:hypothetical protein